VAAPSWSWASIMGGNVYFDDGIRAYAFIRFPLVKFVEARIVRDGGDTKELLSLAKLEIKCTLLITVSFSSVKPGL